MGVPHILTRGIQQALAEGRDDLVRQLARDGQPAEIVDHVIQTIEAMPGLLVALDRAMADDDVPPFAKRLWSTVISYVLEDDDLIPSRDGQVLLGVLDDTYLLHRAAQELRSHMASVYMRSVDGGVDLLTKVLAPEVVRALDLKIEQAMSRASRV